MSRLPQIQDNQATSQQAGLFAAAKSKLGKVPNMVRVLGNSPAALRGYFELSGALGAGEGLTAQQREIVALAVGEANGCEYCLAAHSTLGKLSGLAPEAIEAARRGDGLDDANRAVARLATQIVQSRGRVADSELEAFRAAGFGDDAIAEVVGHVALNIYTNYFNNLAEVDVDFPAAAPLEPSHAAGATCNSGCSV
ncbi:peroxidase-related enzyme [Aeoliella sp. ICT_H6.2]|uniref:Peroxidase-related enzyme n=1 Tax=Aeoliella straminimaris TaxID=2954799 RepID=A0A9X2FIS1_9BACT|nr:peroxidase-related enzyme [Aeoliella straminimaris]MCO6046336.1 peroxidase-related enzyme [Aeoliella straminimaris]